MSITMYKNNWTNKAHTASFDRLYFPRHFLQADGGKYELLLDHRFTTKLFFWQVCVCSAKGETPLVLRFTFLSSFSLIESSSIMLVGSDWLNLNSVLLFLQGEKHFQ